jgi:hypothetical protein
MPNISSLAPQGAANRRRHRHCRKTAVNFFYSLHVFSYNFFEYLKITEKNPEQHQKISHYSNFGYWTYKWVEIFFNIEKSEKTDFLLIMAFQLHFWKYRLLHLRRIPVERASRPRCMALVALSNLLLYGAAHFLSRQWNFWLFNWSVKPVPWSTCTYTLPSQISRYKTYFLGVYRRRCRSSDSDKWYCKTHSHLRLKSPSSSAR